MSVAVVCWTCLICNTLAGAVRQQGFPGVLCDASDAGLTLGRWSAAIHTRTPATQPQDTPAPPVKASNNEDGAEGSEEETTSAEDKTEEENISKNESRDDGEDGSKDGAASASAPSATSRMLLVSGEVPSGDNVTRTRDLLTWRLKDTSLLDELTNKILGSGEDPESVSPDGGSAKVSESPDQVLSQEKATGSQTEAASKVRLF